MATKPPRPKIKTRSPMLTRAEQTRRNLGIGRQASTAVNKVFQLPRDRLLQPELPEPGEQETTGVGKREGPVAVLLTTLAPVYQDKIDKLVNVVAMVNARNSDKYHIFHKV